MICERPERITALTCIGCGALTIPRTCPGGCCDERRLALIGAADYELARQRAEQAARDVRQLRTALEEYLVSDERDSATAFPAARERARSTLRDLSRSSDFADDADHIEALTGWWCPRCGGIEAPQPCIGVCIRRPAQWVAFESYEYERDRSHELVRRRRRLRDALREVAFVTPRTGREILTVRALSARARHALADPGPAEERQPAGRERLRT